MCKNKFLALFLTICMMLTSIGIQGIVASAEDVTVINVGQGVTYKLPETVNSVAVTEWTNASGATVTNADTSLVGYRYYTAALEDSSTVKYRVNVGEYKEIMSDNLDSYDVETYGTAALDTETAGAPASLNGAKFEKAAYSTEANYSQKLVKDGNNTVLSFGPHTSGWANTRWTPKDKAAGEAFKVSYKLRVASFDVKNAANGSNTFVQNNFHNSPAVLLRAQVNDGEITKTELRYDGKTADNPVIDDYVSWNQDENGIASMDEYITVDIEGNNVQFAVSVNNNEIADSIEWKSGEIPATSGQKGVIYINLAKRTDDKVNSVTYADDMVYSKAVYVTDTLENVSVNTAVEQGDTAMQTAAVKLNMSDGTTKDFTVNFTADTSEAATGKTTTGTIEGFDGTVPVTYSVAGVSKQTINTYIGADVELADGSKADTTTLGRRYKTVQKDGSIIDYTINVGGWDVKRADDMSRHTNTTVDHDSNEETDALAVVEPASSDGFPMTVYTVPTTESGAVIEEYNGDKALKFTGKNNNDHIRWNLRDGFNGSFKHSMRVNIVTDEQTTASRMCALRVTVKNTNGEIYFYARLLSPKTGETNYYIQPFRSSQQADTKETSVVATQRADGKWETGWFTIDIVGKADTGTRDVYVNGELTHRDYMYYNAPTVPETEEEKEAAAVTDCTFAQSSISKADALAGTTYVDDVSISSYYNFEGDLPSGGEVLIGQGQDAEGELALTFSNGIIKNIPITISGLDTSKIGTSAVTAELEGFDDKVSVNAKVCNYNIEALGFKENGEYISAPKAGGTISDAIFTNVGDYTQGKAVFAWYSSNNKLESSKVVDLSGVAKGETKKVSVNLELPGNIEGGKLKVFVMGASDSIMPVDITELFDSFTKTAPTVYMTGDSTTCDYKVTRFPEAGVGQMFGDYLNGATVVNMARSGLSSQTFIENGYWDTIMNNVKPGDYIFITFGHNDLDDGTFQVNIPKFAKEADEKNANIIMYSPVARRLEAIKGTAWNGFNYGGQMDFMKQYCTDNGIPYIDMTTLSQTHIQGLSDADSAKLYMVDVYSNYKNYEGDERWAQSIFNTEAGRNEQKLSTDNSHFTFFGADTWAQMLAQQIKDKNLVLSDYIVNTETAITYPNLD